jgi:elongation factor 1-alpha
MRTAVEPNLTTLMGELQIRMAVVGNVDAGKSTLIGTLISSELDDGRGANRSLVLKHKHEKESGRTTSCSTHILGFDESGQTLPCGKEAEAARVVSLIDLAGHEKYLKTTIRGVSRCMPDYALLLVNAGQGPTSMTVHHMNLCVACNVPFVAVLTKVDSCPAHVLRQSRAALNDLVKKKTGTRPYPVWTGKDVENVQEKMHAVVPVAEVSSTTGVGLDLIKKLLFVLPRRRTHEQKKGRPFEFLVDQFFTVRGVGTVVSGFCNAGVWNKGQELHLGPLRDGSYVRAPVRTAHIARTLVDTVYAGHDACFAVSLTKAERRKLERVKGLVGLRAPAKPATSFVADIDVVRGEPTTMIPGRYKATAHILHIRTSVKLESVDRATGDPSANAAKLPEKDDQAVLRPGNRVRATFTLMDGPMYLRANMRVILREGHIRAVGVIRSTNSAG